MELIGHTVTWNSWRQLRFLCVHWSYARQLKWVFYFRPVHCIKRVTMGAAAPRQIDKNWKMVACVIQSHENMYLFKVLGQALKKSGSLESSTIRFEANWTYLVASNRQARAPSLFTFNCSDCSFQSQDRAWLSKGLDWRRNAENWRSRRLFTPNRASSFRSVVFYPIFWDYALSWS